MAHGVSEALETGAPPGMHGNVIGETVVERVMRRLCEAALLIMLVIVGLDIVTRYVFHFSYEISDEFGSYMLVAMTFLSLSVCQANGAFHRIPRLAMVIGNPGALLYARARHCSGPPTTTGAPKTGAAVTPEFQIILVFGLFLGLLTLGMSVPFAITVPAFIYLLLQGGWSGLNGLGIVSWGSMNVFALTAVPLFMFMADILSVSGLSARIYSGLAKLVSRLPGGLLQRTSPDARCSPP